MLPSRKPLRLASFEARMRDRRVRQLLIGSAVVTLALYMVPFGRLLGYPLMLLSTLVHEVGHGLAGLAVGGNFEQFVMFGNGSGVARVTGVSTGWGNAVVAAGGLVGPAILALFGFLFVRRERVARVSVALLALAALAADILVVRNVFGVVFVGALALGLAWVVVRRPAADSQLLLSFVAVQMAVSVFSRGDYLFTDVAQTGAGELPSDVANMATALGGTYWMWGLACGALSVAVLVAGLWWALRDRKR